SYLTPRLHPPKSILFPYTTLFRSIGLDKHLKHSPDIPALQNHSPFAGELVHTIRCNLTLCPCRRHGAQHDKNQFCFHCYIYFERSEEHTSELQSRENLVCRLLLEK